MWPRIVMEDGHVVKIENCVESTPKSNVDLLRNVFDAHAPLCFHHRNHAGSILISHRYTRSPRTLIVIQEFTAILELRTPSSHTSQCKKPFPIRWLHSPVDLDGRSSLTPQKTDHTALLVSRGHVKHTCHFECTDSSAAAGSNWKLYEDRPMNSPLLRMYMLVFVLHSSFGRKKIEAKTF